jgi:DNA-binding SARP family transcriptional activator/pimeloyl-ACP methyl ester carboxylesterase
VQVSLLGPLRIETESGEVAIAAAKERSLLAALALSARHVVGADALVDALWGDAPPATARKTLQTYVSNLRRALGPDVLLTESTGYVLSIDADAVDVGRFRALVRAGEDALRRGSIDRARDALGEALAQWRGEPLAGVAPHTGLGAEAVRLREEYLTALETRIGADLAAGGKGELVGELEALVREHPFRERLWAHLMVALYRGGRQADALAAYGRARSILREELGLEPGGELRRVERAVLEHDRSLEASPARPAPQLAALASARPPVRYATCPDGVHVAYRIVGDGPVDIIAVPGFVSHLDMWWDAPTDHLVRRLASFSRLILFDKRGMGLSDRPSVIDVEHWVEDTLAVLDAAGSERAVILGISAGAPTAALFAAIHPQRSKALILYGGYARFLPGDGYDPGYDRITAESFVRNLQSKWGSGAGLSALAPSLKQDPAARAFWARCQTLAASPTAAAAFLRALMEIDVRHALPTITSPTLILHAARDKSVPVEAARSCRDLIRGAELVELDSDIHLMWLSDIIAEVTAQIERFVGRIVPSLAEFDRALATVLAVAVPDPDDWPEDAFRSTVEGWRGRPMRTLGLATFDGPMRAVRCAQTVVAALADRGRSIGAAIHSGECVMSAQDVHGVAVDIARRLAVDAACGEVLVSQTVRDVLVGSSVELEGRGHRRFDGIDGLWDVFSVAPLATEGCAPSGCAATARADRSEIGGPP